MSVELLIRVGRRGAVAVVAIAMMMFAQPAHASVSTTSDQTARVNGTVYAIAQVGDLTIVGGEFTTVGGRPRSNVAAIRADGTVDPNFNPSVNGPVHAVAGSEDGATVYLGGTFTAVGGQTRANLAAVDADAGVALANWQADTTGVTPDVTALATHGDRLYVGGRFGFIDGRARPRLAALDQLGDVVTSFIPRPNGGVRAVQVSPDGATVYVGGGFSGIGGQVRPWGIAGVSSVDGAATSFNPGVGSDITLTLDLSPDGSRLYFSTPDNRLFAYDTGSDVPLWIRKTSGDTQAILASATEVYIGGHFSQITTYKIKRQFLASLRPDDGTVTSWDPHPTGGSMGVWAIAATPNALLVGGTFTEVDGVFRARFARFPGTP
ncbi:delta-60 repeat domain-containing protein [Nocardioides jensenii]|uniref:delta-60 repeat domain-containing protein n=1 Tax=Nocardioides jensenii TaxID=1843 RepID=UPI0009E76A76|nr:delta-60 repeat domain-containing protein [Nocardioides jensenii]